MNTDAYSLSDSYVSVNGGGPGQAIDEFFRKTIGNHYFVAAAIITILVIVLVWIVYFKHPAEKFNPTALSRFQQRDGLGESLEPNRGSSVFAQQVQHGGGGQFVVDPSAISGQPGSLAWQVLHSGDFDCNKRQAVGDDAWAWMNGVVHESMGNKPKNDNDFSRLLAGQ